MTQAPNNALKTLKMSLGVLEYWLIDPEQQMITLLELQNGSYREVGTFRGQDRITSPNFPDLTLTAQQVLTPENY
ncbi:hypothetical protein HJG54_07730 [Leptolyngbya sp. NK1-12]|jgi:Uma2 family endonuclease|uniref:Putative restriction endonuclease domain-containing protein n=1 Tax=Leptolyngbya sp. NK1-12 TaxID=2547451 RepID=A0AA97AFU6_9CYAN|nr:Uma2 family endonuclease [Elainella sp. C42_A2020_010]WNZ22754.1 hypothetical protein HJG54_07730 [Leptolyngbya sp. NK1-12]